MNAKQPKGEQDALRPLASLLSKSEKALGKLLPGTWQHAMLERNVRALKLASGLMDAGDGGLGKVEPDAWTDASRALADMARRTEESRRKFLPGTSQHTLQNNRLKALRLALKAVREESGRRRV